ncbi:MAG: RsmD family RNA methyltransferase [Urechidicola sp.]|nr:RsmD family RNA methyltransferase [Urechidicola sp.]
MRIISGTYKGRRLTAPKKLPVRPTTDMAKEALFNILNNRYYFDEIKVIDLFSGTGNISYEFASRGTENITAIDAHYGCVKYINAVTKEFEFNITTLKSDVFKFLERTALKADVIFADPPYNMDSEQFLKIASFVFERDLLEEGGILIIEHSNQTDLSEHPQFSFSKKYGGNLFSFLK